MKKSVCVLGFAITTLLLNSCGMKECKCVDTNLSFINDSIDENNSRVDTVFNYTHSDCEQYNKKEILDIDTNRTIHHTVICEEN